VVAMHGKKLLWPLTCRATDAATRGGRWSLFGTLKTVVFAHSAAATDFAQFEVTLGKLRAFHPLKRARGLMRRSGQRTKDVQHGSSPLGAIGATVGTQYSIVVALSPGSLYGTTPSR
jgi:hypothetical protein